jgi:hypothetical protein
LSLAPGTSPSADPFAGRTVQHWSPQRVIFTDGAEAVLVLHWEAGPFRPRLAWELREPAADDC